MHCYMPVCALLHVSLSIVTCQFVHCYVSICAFLHVILCIVTCQFVHCYMSVCALLHVSSLIYGLKKVAWVYLTSTSWKHSVSRTLFQKTQLTPVALQYGLDMFYRQNMTEPAYCSQCNSPFRTSVSSTMVKVYQSRYRPGVAQRVPGS